MLSAHAAKHVWGRLVWLCDIARIMNLPTLDWNWIGSSGESLGNCAHPARHHAPGEPALRRGHPRRGAGESSGRSSRDEHWLDEIQAHIVSEAVFNVESLAYFRLMMRLRERPADRLRFLQRLALHPGPSEWQAVRLPGPLFPLYRLVRLSRLAARFVRA